MPRRVNLPKQRRGEIQKVLFRNYMEYIDHRSGWAAKLPEWYRVWRAWSASKKMHPWPGASNLFMPVSTENLERVHAGYMEATYPDRDFVTVVPTETYDDDYSTDVQKWLMWAHREDMQSYPNVDRAYHRMMVWGSSVLYPYWSRRVRKTRYYEYIGKEGQNEKPDAKMIVPRLWEGVKFDDMTYRGGNSQVVVQRIVDKRPIQATVKILSPDEQTDAKIGEWEIEVEEPVVRHDRPILAEPDIEDIVVPPYAVNLQDPDNVFVRLWLTPEEVLSNLMDEKYRLDPDDEQRLKKAMKDKYISKSQPGGEGDDLGDYRDLYTGVQAGEAKVRDKVLIVKCHCRIDTDRDEKLEDLIITFIVLGQGDWLWARCEYLDSQSPTGERPFCEAHWCYNHKTWYSIGMIEWLYNLQSAFNTQYNQRIDRDNILSLPTYGYRTGTATGRMKLRLSPGQGIPFEHPSDLKQFQFTAQMASTIHNEMQLREDMDRMVGVNDFSFGPPQNRAAHRTQGGMLMLMGQAQVLPKRAIRRNNISFTKPLFNLTHGMYSRFGPETVWFHVLGEEQPRQISIEHLRRKYHFYMEPASEAANQEFVRATEALASEMLLANPLVQQSPKRIWNVTAAFLRAHGKRHIEKFIGEEPEHDVAPKEPEEENRALGQGVSMMIHPADNHQQHISEHQSFLTENLGTIDPEHVGVVKDHIQMHKQAMAAARPGPGGDGNMAGMLEPGISAGIGGGERGLMEAPADMMRAGAEEPRGMQPPPLGV